VLVLVRLHSFRVALLVANRHGAACAVHRLVTALQRASSPMFLLLAHVQRTTDRREEQNRLVLPLNLRILKTSAPGGVAAPKILPRDFL
jgi:hypothetical protein